MKRLALMALACLAFCQTFAQQPDGKDYAIVNISVCNMRRTPDFDAEMVTQAQMGMTCRVLDFQTWYQIQSPDDYTGWTHPKALHRVNLQEMQAWNRAEKVVVTALNGVVYSKPNVKSQTISDVVAGDRMRYLGKKGKFYAVALPDGREGYLLKADGKPLEEWRRGLKNDAESILDTAKQLLGFPYIWAGASVKGMDCSGFVRTVLLQHDMIIPRDASQQAVTGQRIEIAKDFSNLQPGDLVFFGRVADGRERVSHVAFYLGGKEFIHCLGLVERSSFDPAAPNYDAYNTGRLLFAARVLPYINKEKGLNTTDQNPYYSADFR
ncbi:MAG: NlpC/P60 family protein [Bacteroidales bacterium]|nr:NlpC/P60 family protein [Bacteroidales bacterium]